MRRLLLGLAIASIAALSPCWVHADDQQIAQQIVQQLRQQKTDGNLTGFGIDLEVESGIVWLKGHVSSSEQQNMVLDIARRVSGVEQVVNDLQVKTAQVEPQPQPQPKPQVRPALLKSESGSKFLQKPSELLTNLRGSVERAFRPAKDDPAKDVQPRQQPQVAQVAPTPAQPTPAQPTPAQPTPAEPTLARPHDVIASTPTVARHRPVARQPREAAPQKVQAAPVSQIARTTPSDEQLAEEVIGKLRTQKERGTLRNFDVDVQVNNQVVWISGRVASEAQQSLVLDISRRVRGVKQVVNDLHVASSAPVQVVSTPVSPAAADLAPVSQEPTPIGTAVAATRAPAPFQYAPAQAAPVAASRAPLAFAPLSPWPIHNKSWASPWLRYRPLPASPALVSITRPCPDTPGPVTQLIRIMVLSRTRDSTRRPRGPTLVPSTPIPRSPWDGGRSRWNGMTAGGCWTSRASKSRIYRSDADQAPPASCLEGGAFLMG